MKKNNYYFFLFDIILNISVYILFYFNKFGHIYPKGIYSILLMVFIAYLYTLSTYYNKYTPAKLDNYRTYIKTILLSSIITLFLITSTVSLTELISLSRQFLIKITLTPMIIEIAIVIIFKKAFSTKYYQEATKETDTADISDSNYKFIWVIIGAFMLFIIYILMIKLKTGAFYLYPWSERLLLVLFASWLIGFLLTKKYSVTKFENISYVLGPYIKSGIVMLLLAAMVYFFFRIESLSRFLLFGTIIIFTILETISFFFYYVSKKHDTDSNIDDLFAKTNFSWNIEDFDFDAESAKYDSGKDNSIRSIFNQISSLDDRNQIIDFLEKNLLDIKINFYSSAIFSTTSLENIEILRNNSKNLLINLRKINDIRHINQYLITSHSRLIPDGILVGHFLPIETSFDRLKNQMPKLIFTLIYPFHFLFSRIIPKIPRIKQLYFIVTRGNNRSISKAEMYGRLNFCGFKIEKDIIINEKIYFIAKKVKTVSKITNPSYHPIVKLTRIGYNKKLIKIHKFRTMHPYSEFLQKDIYEENELDDRGKFKNDFRITSWGKIMRKFWIDELPQIYDWMQGRINIVGVRALSEQYFSLYPKELQDLRTKFKPGIIPPYYVDMPETLEEICKSEEQYLNQKAKSPLKTDLRYGIKAIINILFKGARSG
jgi:lipopolysaccharide/colanic/teichoic acid biosynthesis glycosyltransferase